MGRSRGGLSTKIHALVDLAGRPVRLILTPGQAGDAPVAQELMAGLAPGSTLLADRAYDTDTIRALAETRGAWANIPAKRTRKQPFAFSAWLYRHRNRVKRVRLFSRTRGVHRLTQPDQTVPRARHAIRSTTGQLSRRPKTRSHPHLACGQMSPHPSSGLKLRLAGCCFQVLFALDVVSMVGTGHVGPQGDADDVFSSCSIGLAANMPDKYGGLRPDALTRPRCQPAERLRRCECDGPKT